MSNNEDINIKFDSLDNIKHTSKENDTFIKKVQPPTNSNAKKPIKFGAIKFNISTSVLPPKKQEEIQLPIEEEEEKKDQIRQDDKHLHKDNVTVDIPGQNINNEKNTPANITTTSTTTTTIASNIQVGPPRPPLKKNNGDDDSSSSDSDDDDSEDEEKDKHQQQQQKPTPMIGPPRPVQSKKRKDKDDSDSDDSSSSSSDSDSDSDDDDSEDEEKEEIARWMDLSKKIPISHEVVMKCHAKEVSSIALDPSGSRMLTGSYDCRVRFWDFNGMDSSLKSFREIEPMEGTHVRSVLFSNTGDRFMVLPYTVQMKLYDRDGFSKAEFVSGDRYIQDLNHTKGHVAAITGGCWCPTENDQIITSSLDSTIRIWDVNQPKKNQSVIRPRNSSGAKVAITSCTYDVRGDTVTGGGQDGSIQMFDKRSNSLIKPKTMVTGHQADVSSISYARDGITMISRSLDHTIRVWDLRMLDKSEPLVVWDNIQTDYLESNVIFGSHERLIVAGTSIKDKTDAFGTLVIFDKTSLTKMRQIKVEGTSCINVAWNQRINQIMVGCSDGATRVYYDPDYSEKGIRMCVNKVPRKKDPSDFEPERPIITPNALPLFREENVNKKKDRPSKKSRKPEHLTKTTGARGPNLTQHLVNSMGLTHDQSWKEDARESFLKQADKQ